MKFSEWPLWNVEALAHAHTHIFISVSIGQLRFFDLHEAINLFSK